MKSDGDRRWNQVSVTIVAGRLGAGGRWELAGLTASHVGRGDVHTARIDVPVLNRRGRGVRGPAEVMARRGIG